MQMAWNWTAGGSAWITPSPRERTRPPRASTWAGQPTVEVAAVVVVEEQVVVVIPTMIGDMIEDMTDMKNMTTGTGDDHLHLIIADIDHGQDPAPIAQDATEERKNSSCGHDF